MFYWILNTISKSGLFDDIIVSSDSADYLDLVYKFFPDVFLHCRTLVNASDDSPEYAFIAEAITFFHETSRLISPDELISRFHATSPLQSISDMRASLQAVNAIPSSTSSVLLRSSPIHPGKTILINDSNGVNLALGSTSLTCESVTPKNRQKLEPYYIRSNIITFKKSVLATGSLTGKKCLAVISDSDIHIDIDSVLDFMFAEYIIKNNIKDLFI